MTMDFASRSILNVDMPSWYWDAGVAKTRNLGSLAGTVQLGDGVTPGTFPTQLAPTHGMTFSGGAGVFLNAGNNSAYSFTSGGVDQPFSVECLFRTRATARPLISKSDSISAVGGGEWGFVVGGASPYLQLILSDSVAGAYISQRLSAGTIGYGLLYHAVGVYSGSGGASGISLYLQGAPAVSSAFNFGAYVRMYNTGIAVRVGGGMLVSGFAPLIGEAYNAAVYPFALQPGEVSQLKAQRFAALNRGF